MIIAHRIQLKPNKKHEEFFRKSAGASRAVWNWALDAWDCLYTGGAKPSGAELSRMFTKRWRRDMPWLSEINAHSYRRIFIDLDKAWKTAFKKYKHGGKRLEAPRFKSKGKSRDSFYCHNAEFKVLNRRVKINKCGTVSMTENLRFDGKIMGATISREADKWFIAIQVDVGDYKKVGSKVSNTNPLGIDMGIKTHLTLSNGEKLDGPKSLKNNLSRLRKISKSFSRKTKGSNSYYRVKVKLQKIHKKIKDIRKDFQHKSTTDIIKNNSNICIEDLNVKGMMSNSKLARHIADIGIYEIRRQLEYKSAIYGRNIVVRDRFFPSSKLCSKCNNKKEVLSLSERTYECEHCNLSLDRDLNAAINIARGPVLEKKHRASRET